MKWNEMPRRGPSPQWKRFLSEGWNQDVLGNMDCNDEVKDRLLAHMAIDKFSSIYWADEVRRFERTFACPWMMRDLYQLFNWIWRQEGDAISRFRRFLDEIGDLTDQEGRKLNFDYLFPEEFPDFDLTEVEEFAEGVPF